MAFCKTPQHYLPWFFEKYLPYQLSDDGDDSEDEVPQHTRREVRPSAKAAQQSNEQKEAAARKATKTAKVAQKQQQQELESGEEPEPTPLPDTVFQNHESRRITVLVTLMATSHRLTYILTSGPSRTGAVVVTAASPSSSSQLNVIHPSRSNSFHLQPQPPLLPRCNPFYFWPHPPSAPASGSKRARSPAEDLRPSQAQKLNDHQGCARAKDYDSMTQEIVSTAVTYFRCLLATEDAFPDHTSETHLLTLAWTMARQEHKLAMDMTPDIAKLITSRTSQMRGELKTKVSALVELTFGFESGQNKCNVRKNRQLVEDLKEGMGEGATHPEMFGPILCKPMLALVWTAIECGIDEWATGIKADVPFTSADYRSVYIDHTKAMTDFEMCSAPHDILGNILTCLHNIGHFHSGAQPLVATAPATSLSTSAIDAAIREYDEDEETVTEGELGEDSE
ncbi:hypothetical protein B0H14DRAFT_3718746 [Mycena olivaceomarginata]|nr:hypothetical protein B0H14DRAFT_3518413 [Mycena olivaceomarginata]KAJ7828593.1 hypothetical protein B0H14DRAFT_3718746 [Mycena olivaceomarginata]